MSPPTFGPVLNSLVRECKSRIIGLVSAKQAVRAFSFVSRGLFAIFFVIRDFFVTILAGVARAPEVVDAGVDYGSVEINSHGHEMHLGPEALAEPWDPKSGKPMKIRPEYAAERAAFLKSGKAHSGKVLRGHTVLEILAEAYHSPEVITTHVVDDNAEPSTKNLTDRQRELLEINPLLVMGYLFLMNEYSGFPKDKMKKATFALLKEYAQLIDEHPDLIRRTTKLSSSQLASITTRARDLN